MQYKNIKIVLSMLFFLSLNTVYACCYITNYYKVANINADDTLSVRSEPDWRSKKIAELAYNTGKIAFVKVVENELQYDLCVMNGESKWCKINSPAKGWVNTSYLKFDCHEEFSDFGTVINTSCN